MGKKGDIRVPEELGRRQGTKIMSLFQDELSLGYGCLGTRAGDRDL